ncbi:MAG: hypothetical protein Q4C75_00690 [Bergeyella zoohelcum]|nr:hypothetical protein [Bergeyella zoohelcum]
MILLICLLILSGIRAQYSVEDIDDSDLNVENRKAIFSADLSLPMEHFIIKTCPKNSIYYTQPKTGERAFREELERMMQSYINKEVYALNGLFYFVFEINPNGEISGVEILPRVANVDLLQNDMQFILKRLKTKWYPAKCNEKPMNSKVRMRVNFSTEMFDL